MSEEARFLREALRRFEAENNELQKRINSAVIPLEKLERKLKGENEVLLRRAKTILQNGTIQQ